MPASGWDRLDGVPAGDDVWRTMADRHRGPLRTFFRARPVLVDLLVCLSYGLLALFPALLSTQNTSNWIVLPGLLVMVALFFRRRYPLTVLAVVATVELVTMASGVPLSSIGAGIWFALYAVARVYATTRVYAIGLLITALEAVAITLWGNKVGVGLGPTPDPVGAIVFVGVVTGFILVTNFVAIVLGSSMRNSALHQAELEGWARRAQDLARGRERNRIAGEMHDIVAHSLSVMIALSDGAAKVAPKNPERAIQVMGDVARTGRSALADLRRSLGVLRTEENDAPLSPAGAGADLDEMLDGFRATGLPLRVDREGLLPEDPALRLSAVRIIQESLTNALRYARRPSEVLVWMRADERGVHLRVRDDGAQASRRPRSQGSGIGLSGMVERARLFGGTVTAGPLESGGWGVEAWLPAPAAVEGREARGREEEQ